MGAACLAGGAGRQVPLPNNNRPCKREQGAGKAGRQQGNGHRQGAGNVQQVSKGKARAAGNAT